MKIVSPEQMRELDRRTIEEGGVPGETLMDRAGRGLADVVRRLVDQTGFESPLVRLLAGRGNNGGDAFAAARYLKEMEMRVEVWLAGAANQVKGDALIHLSRMKSARVPLRELPVKEDWEDAAADAEPAEFLVDGLLGTGGTGPARGPVVAAIQYLNAMADDALVVSVDIPSGLDATTGEAMGDTVTADITVTMGIPKLGLVQPSALDYVGSLEVVDIGLPPDFVDEISVSHDLEFIYLTDLKPLLPRRARAAHKGEFGHLLVVGGAPGYSGAVALAAKAALRSGVGLVTVLTPEPVAPVVAGLAAEIMVFGGRPSSSGSLAADAVSGWRDDLSGFDAVLVGPGLTRHDDSRRLVEDLLRRFNGPLVVDADAISVFAGCARELRRDRGSLILTPHPGELALLMGTDAQAIQRDRFAAARAAMDATAATVVLKGAGTVVGQTGLPLAVNLTGNPGMATGGAGDVLAGVVAGLLAQGLKPYDASRAAVYLHGRAGDLVALRKSQAGLVAGDLVEELPFAFRDVTLR